MPLYLPSTRRQFIQATSAFTLAPWCKGQEQPKTELWHLLSDTHIAEDTATVSRGVNMAEHLQKAVQSVLSCQEKEPAFGLLIDGDLALRDGQPGDYATLVKLLQPLREAGIDLHLTLGNHDNREVFHTGCNEALSLRKSALESHHCSVITSALVNWVLLDSLEIVDKTPGLIGEEQLGWLKRTLNDLPDKPTLVFVHHNPQGPVPEGKKPGGLKDTEALLQLLESHPKVKGYIFGHTHNWEITRRESGLYLINLPAVAYVFKPERPSGYVQARLHSKGVDLMLQSIDPSHPQHGKVESLTWS
jgi:3',5'-cyclic-AMP phosphodiesterase